MKYLFSRVLILALALLPILPLPAAGAEITGTVVSVTTDTLTIRTSDDAAGDTTEILVTRPAPPGGHGSEPASWPRCVKLGAVITIDGEWNAGSGTMAARRIHGIGRGRGKHHDPTGARARLRRCRRWGGGHE